MPAISPQWEGKERRALPEGSHRPSGGTFKSLRSDDASERMQQDATQKYDNDRGCFLGTNSPGLTKRYWAFALYAEVYCKS